MADPHVAGAAALLYGHPKFGKADYKAVRKALLENVRKDGMPKLKDKCITEGVLDLSSSSPKARPSPNGCADCQSRPGPAGPGLSRPVPPHVRGPPMRSACLLICLLAGPAAAADRPWLVFCVGIEKYDDPSLNPPLLDPAPESVAEDAVAVWNRLHEIARVDDRRSRLLVADRVSKGEITIDPAQKRAERRNRLPFDDLHKELREFLAETTGDDLVVADDLPRGARGEAGRRPGGRGVLPGQRLRPGEGRERHPEWPPRQGGAPDAGRRVLRRQAKGRGGGVCQHVPRRGP